MDTNATDKRIANISEMPREALQEAIKSAKNAREKVRAKLASGEAIIIPKEINDFLEAKAS